MSHCKSRCNQRNVVPENHFFCATVFFEIMCAQNGRGLKICNYLEYTFRLRMLLEVTRSTVWQQCTRGKVTYQGDLIKGSIARE